MLIFKESKDILGTIFFKKGINLKMYIMTWFCWIYVSIALISNRREATTFYISILGELNVKKSWIKLFIVGLNVPLELGRRAKFASKIKMMIWSGLI